MTAAPTSASRAGAEDGREKQHACCLEPDKLKSRCTMAAPAQEGAAGFAGRTRVHLHSFLKVRTFRQDRLRIAPEREPGRRGDVMPELPDRPDLDQLRRQARELLRLRGQWRARRCRQASRGVRPGHAVGGPASGGPRIRLPKRAGAESRGRKTSGRAAVFRDAGSLEDSGAGRAGRWGPRYAMPAPARSPTG